MEDEFDDLLAQIAEPVSPKQCRVDDNAKALTEPVDGPSINKEQKPLVNKSHCVLVNNKQRGNPLLKSITSVPWEFDDIIPDYEMGKNICALFLSLRYHNMNPDYISNRLKELGKGYELRVLLVQIDLKEPHIPLKNLTRICLLADLTLMLAWSAEEAGKIIENYKIYENKPPDKIMERIENDPHQKIVNALSSVKPVNKTDAMTLIKTFGSLSNIVKAKEARLAQCPGFGARKAQKLYKTLHETFLKKDTSKLVTECEKEESFSEDIDIAEIEKAESETMHGSQ